MRKLAAVFALLALAALPQSSPAAATTTEGFITSFDGTKIHYYMHLPPRATAADPVPVILRTHGWGGSGEATVAAGSTAERLIDEGYAVMTWDQRGFGRSGGQAEIDDPAFEGRDVSALIDEAARNGAIRKSGNDPVVGMTGGSYAGGIQFSAASVDDRIDALAPEIAWHDLPDALFPNNVSKLGWDVLLYGVGQTGYRGYVENQSFAQGHIGTLNPNIHASFVTSTATNDPSPWHDFYADHSVASYVDRVDIPTLVLQGTIDTLFPINHGFANAAAVRANGAPVKVVLFNGGHTIGSGIPAGNARAHMNDAIIDWFARYLKGQNVDTGPDIEWQDGTAAWHSKSFSASSSVLEFSGTATGLVGTAVPSGGGGIAAGNPNVEVTSARIPIATGAPGGTQIMGAPRISGRIGGVAPDGFLFFKLVDADTNTVLDDQVTPYRVTIATGSVPFSINLHGVAWVLPEGHDLVLEISTGSAMYTNSRVPGVMDVTLQGTVPLA